MTISINLSHQHIVITGAARGIGAAIAHLLALADADLTLVGRNKDIEAEAQAQAICMMTNDFHRAYHAFVAKNPPIFEGD